MKTKTITAMFLLTLAALAGCASKGVVRGGEDLRGQRAYRYFLDGEMGKAVEQYKKGYARARGADDTRLAAQSLANIGRVYAEAGRHDSAALYLARAHEEFVMISDTAGAAGAAAFLSVSAAEAGDAEMSRKWLAAASVYNGKDSKHYNAVIKARVDWALTSKINNAPALDAAETFYRKTKNHSALITIQILKADNEVSIGNCSQALYLLDNALSATEKSQELYRRSGILLKLSSLKFCMNDQASGRHFYDRAAGCAPKGIPVPPIEDVMNCTITCR